jgi:hypothetical protein
MVRTKSQEKAVPMDAEKTESSSSSDEEAEMERTKPRR